MANISKQVKSSRKKAEKWNSWLLVLIYLLRSGLIVLINCMCRITPLERIFFVHLFSTIFHFLIIFFKGVILLVDGIAWNRIFKPACRYNATSLFTITPFPSIASHSLMALPVSGYLFAQIFNKNSAINNLMVLWIFPFKMRTKLEENIFFPRFEFEFVH